jgi:hypothetical protein
VSLTAFGDLLVDQPDFAFRHGCRAIVSAPLRQVQVNPNAVFRDLVDALPLETFALDV